MIFIRWFFLTILVLLAELSSFILVPLAVLFADKGGRLPNGFRWLETHDALGWEGGHYEPSIKETYDKFGKRVALIRWLLRNKAYSLRYRLGIKVDLDNIVLKQHGTPEVFSNSPAWWLGMMTDTSGRKYFEFSAAINVLGLFSFGFRSGWKLLPYFLGNKQPLGTSSAGMFIGVAVRSTRLDDNKY